MSPRSSLPAVSVPFAVMMTVSVLTTADAVAVMLSWTVPLDVVIVEGLNVIVVPSESPDALNVSGAVELSSARTSSRPKR